MHRNIDPLSPWLLESIKRLSIFQDIDDSTLISCLKGIEEIHLLKNELIFKKGESYHKGIYFILSGSAMMSVPSGNLDLTKGDAMGLYTFLSKTMYTVTAVAKTDSDMLFVDEFSIYNLMDKSDDFRTKFMGIIKNRVNSLDKMTMRATSLSSYQSVGNCVSSPLITLHNSKSVADAAQMMSKHNVGALVIMNRKHVLKGLLTASDLTKNYLSNAILPPKTALAENYANKSPLILPQEYPLVETLVQMLKLGQDYALITKKSKLAGIISRTDIMCFLSSGSDAFGASIAKVETIDELKNLVQTLPTIVENIMNNTSLFREILPMLSTNHLIIQKKVFDLAKKRFKKENNFEIVDSDYCMITLGSLARRELTLALRQINAMIINDNVSEEELKKYRAFGKLFSEMLTEIGYEKCSQGLTLDNPDMILKLDDWKQFISKSIHKSNEKNIPYTRIIFDCERFEGDETIIWSFKEAIQTTLKEKALFFGRLISYQSHFKIPISQFGSFITETSGEYSDTIDLMENAMSFIIFTSQALSFYKDLIDTNTIKRLEHLKRVNIVELDLLNEAQNAYESIVDLILHEQLRQINNGEKASFRIKPGQLSMYNQEKLKRSLHIIARFFGEGTAYFK